MPSLSIEEVELYSSFKADVFVETGTYQGDTINNVKNQFKSVYSIELDKNYANMAVHRFRDDKNVYIVEGNSSVVLEPLCNSITEPAFFWLDGHWSGGDTARGDKDCPLIEELRVIVKNLKSKCIIAIDDVRLFGTKINEDWSGITIDNVLSEVKGRLESYKFFPSYLNPSDRMVLVLNELVI